MKSFQLILLVTALSVLGYTQVQLAAIRHSLDAGEARQELAAISTGDSRCAPLPGSVGGAGYLPLATSELPVPQSVNPTVPPSPLLPEAAEQVRADEELAEGVGSRMHIVEDIVARRVIATGDIQKALSELSALPDAQRQQALQQLAQGINSQEVQILPPR